MLLSQQNAPPDLKSHVNELLQWIESRGYAGYEPYDLLNSPWLTWADHQPFASIFIQSGKRLGGLRGRKLLGIPESRNPKALGLILSAYCELTVNGSCGPERATEVRHLLESVRSPGEREFCWGYDWNYVSLRGARLRPYAPNAVATVFCAQGLLDYAETFRDTVARMMAFSSARWVVTRLQRSVDDDRHLCLSYTPQDRTRIFNSSALIGAFLARVDQLRGIAEYALIARKIMQFLADAQQRDGSWTYGASRLQSWIDSFHTGYNLCALHDYQRFTGDTSFADVLARGYAFYKDRFFLSDGTPRYYHDRTYPIDIHACSQAIITFTFLRALDREAMPLALRVAHWTVSNLRNPDGSFGYQVHRFHKDSTPYLRWSQAWMLYALARLRNATAESRFDERSYLD